jgi:alkylation response protein AidB-like acyl-CoA dehydrogenase
VRGHHFGEVSRVTAFAGLALRDEIRAWLAENWDPELPLVQWRARLHEAGWACPTWPVAYGGRDLAPEQARVVGEELDAVGAPGTPVGGGMFLAAPTLLRHASEELKQELLPGIVTGRDTWCQLFSEPGNGSDLAGLTTRAEFNDGAWVVSGQKVWTTSADHAKYAMLLARTDWRVPKNEGITYFVLPMQQPGVEVRPIRQMNNRSSFFEVFLTEARAPERFVVGAVCEGWNVARTTLTHERGLGAMRRTPRQTDRKGRAVEEAREERDEYLKTYEWYPQRAGHPELVLERARGSTGPVRLAAADVVARMRMAQWTSARAQATARVPGRKPSVDGSVSKLLGTELARRAAAVHSSLSGADTMLAGPGSPDGGLVADILTSVPAGSIAGGTDEIQKNVIAERLLGLPREDTAAAREPFRPVHGTQNPANGQRRDG